MCAWGVDREEEVENKSSRSNCVGCGCMGNRDDGKADNGGGRSNDVVVMVIVHVAAVMPWVTMMAV